MSFIGSCVCAWSTPGGPVCGGYGTSRRKSLATGSTSLLTPCFLTVEAMWPAGLYLCHNFSTTIPLTVSPLTVSQKKNTLYCFLKLFLCRKFAIPRKEAADTAVRGLLAAQGRPFFPPPAPITAHGSWLVDVAPAISMAAPPSSESCLPLTEISVLTKGLLDNGDGLLISVTLCSRQWAWCHRTRQLSRQDH